MRDTKPARISSADIPLPFGGKGSVFRGQLSDIGTTLDNRSIVDMTFDDGEVSEAFGVNNITFVLTPTDPASFSSSAPLSVALTAGKKLYGYKYTTQDAVIETERRDESKTVLVDEDGNLIVYPYSYLFPGEFFASDNNLADENSLPTQFAAAHTDITFKPLSEVTLDADARFIIIAEEGEVPAVAGPTRMTVRDLQWCGDGDIQDPEQCDGGNGCNELCTFEAYLSVAIDGPATATYARGAADAVLGTIVLNSNQGPAINVEKLFVLIQGTTDAGESFVDGRPGISSAADQIMEIMEFVRLRNTISNEIIPGVRLTGFNDSGASSTTADGAYQMVRFDNIPVENEQTYQLLVNFIDNSGLGPKAAPAGGDRFRIHICNEATMKLNAQGALIANTTGCALGGFFSTMNTSYQMIIKDSATSSYVGDFSPGGTITGNYQVMADPGLILTVKETTTANVAVANQKNINLLRFEARATDTEDVLLTDLIFSKAGGNSLLNGTNYQLWVDTNDDNTVDAILQSAVSPVSGQVIFGNMTGGGYPVPKAKNVIFEVHADIASSLTDAAPALAIRFDTGATFVLAETVSQAQPLLGFAVKQPDGNYESQCSACSNNALSQIQVTTVDSVRYGLIPHGYLAVSKSSTPVRSRQLLGGMLGDEILRLQLHANYEDMDVTQIVLTASGSDADTISSNVDRLELFNVGSETSFTSATISGCGIVAVPANSFCALINAQQLIVSKNTVTDILVRPLMRTDTDGAASGQSVIVALTAYPDVVRARGLISSNISPVVVSRPIVGSQNVVVLSKITSITSVDPNQDGTAIPTGHSDIGQFKFANAPNNNTKNGPNKVALGSILFSVDASNVLLKGDGFAAYNKADPTSIVHCSPQALDGTPMGGDITGAFLVSCTFADSTVPNVIDPDSDATFVLSGNVSDSAISFSKSSSLQVSIRNLSDNTSAFSPPGSHLTWHDEDSAGRTRFDWMEWASTAVLGTNYGGGSFVAPTQTCNNTICEGNEGAGTVPCASGVGTCPNPNLCGEDCPLCGNYNDDGTEQCDDGAQNSTTCSAPYNGACNYCEKDTCLGKTMTGPRCGDGIQQKADGEECDDGNTNDKDSCSSACKLVAAPF
jgi:cysteine-rich repeat protein